MLEDAPKPAPNPSPSLDELMRAAENASAAAKPASGGGWIFFVLFLFLVAGISAAAYFFYFEPLWQAPEAVMVKMAAAEGQLTARQSKLELRVEAVGKNDRLAAAAGSVDNLLLALRASFNTVYPDRHSGVVELETFGLPFGDLVAATSSSITAEVEYRLLGADSYFRLKHWPENNWLVLNRALDVGWIKLDPTAVALPQALGNIKLTELLRAGARLPGGKIEGVSAHHFQIGVNRESWQGGVDGLAAALGQQSVLAPEEVEEFKTLLGQISLPSGEIWIGQKDHLPYRFSLTGLFKGLPDQPDYQLNGKYELDWSAASYNQPAEISAPQVSTSWSEVEAGN